MLRKTLSGLMLTMLFSGFLSSAIAIWHLSVTISPQYPVVDVCGTVTFTATISGGMPPYKIQWYRNGTEIIVVENDTVVSFTFDNVGIEYVKVEVTDSESSWTESINNQVAILPPSTTILKVLPVTNTFHSDETPPGSTFIVNATVLDVTDLGAWQIRLAWNSSLLTYSDIWLPADHVFSESCKTMITPPPDTGPGYVVWGCTYINTPYWTFNGTGTLCQIKLKILTPPTSQPVACNLTLANKYGSSGTFLMNGAGHDVPFTVEKGIFSYTPPTPNQPPHKPTGLSQYKSDAVTVIPEEGTSPEPTIVFKGIVSDPDGDQVRLDIELRQTGEAFTGEPTPETISEFVPSGTQITITRYGLVNADYHWQYRAKDSKGTVSNWTEFGATGNIDFTVSLPTAPKITSIDPHEPIVSPYLSIKQYLPIHGEGFVPDSYVNFSDGHNTWRVSRERTRFIDSNNIEVVAGLGTKEGSWHVWITNPDGSQSNNFSFQTQTLTPEYGMKVLELARQYWKDEDTALLMTTIAYLESGWNPHAAGDLVEKGYDPKYSSIGACSWGLWQIFMPAHIEDLKKLANSENNDEIAKWLRDENNNAKAAKMVSEKPQGFTHWTTYPDAVNKKREVAELLGIKRVSSFKCPVNVTISDEYGRIISEVENQIPRASFEYFNGTDTKIFYLPLNLTYHAQINSTAYGNITIAQITPTESVYEIAFSQLTFDLTSESVAEFHLLPYEANYTLRVDENGDGVMDYELIPEVETLTTEYDIGITEIIPSKTVVGEGYNLPINITVMNCGAYTETFNVTLYVNETFVKLQTVILASGNSTTITFMWNTAGYASGNYTISAYATPLPSETITDDNTYTDGSVQILQTYTLTITTTIGGTTDSAPGTYTYTASSSVQVTAIPNADYIFNHWELDTIDVGSANPYTALIDNNHTLKAVFIYSPPPPPLSASISPLSASLLVGQPVTFTSTVSGGFAQYSYQWYLNGNPVSGATSDAWTFTPTTSGIYYVYLKVTDDTGNTTQSETARITVTTVPVGGYSVPIQLPTTTQPATLHISLLTILTAIFRKIKRKTKRKH